MIEHAEWTCPVCDARGDCIECMGMGTRESYYQVQVLHEHAIRNERGTAARVLEHIQMLPDDMRDRGYWVSKMIHGALRQIREMN